MGEKLYRPILGPDEALLRSKKNPKHKRGISRDSNNRNPDIPEFEEVDVDDLVRSREASYEYAERATQNERAQLSPEQQRAAEELGEALAQLIIVEGKLLFQNVIAPWWRNKVWPAIKRQVNRLSNNQSAKATKQPGLVSVEKIERTSKEYNLLEPLLLQMDDVFEINQAEAQEHMMLLYYHLIGLAMEIQIVGKARIRQVSETDEISILRQRELDQMLVTQISAKLDKLLENPNLHLSNSILREINEKTGGGIRINGDYVPVNREKIASALTQPA